MSKKTQTDLLQEIVDLLTPMSNLAKHKITLINEDTFKQKLLQDHNTAVAEAQQEIKEENGEG